MTRPTIARLCLGVACLTLSIAAVVWLTHDRALLQDRRLHRAEAISQCQSDIRDNARTELLIGGLSPATTASFMDQATITEIHARRSIVTEDVHGLLLDRHRPQASVLSVWEIAGRLTLPPGTPFPSIESKSTFACVAVVFTDNTIITIDRQITPGMANLG